MNQGDDRHVVDIQLGCIGSGASEPSGTDHPSAVAAKEAKETHDGGDSRPRNDTGEQWYHGDTAPYSPKEKTRRRYTLWFYFVVFYGGAIVIGGVLGNSFAKAMKGKAMKVLGYALGQCITVPIVSFLWCPFTWRWDD
uniref:Uncharacterized protein n=1 Tax=Aegilops tauschii TaxID=37682 RepID=M8BNT1_AEGTA